MQITAKYKEITDNINDAQLRGTDIVFWTNQMAIDLNNSEIPTDDINRKKLESNIDSTSQTLSLKNVSYTTQMLMFVRILQKYITDTYGSVNTFLSENSIKVKSTFAEISEEVGYPISSINIEGIS